MSGLEKVSKDLGFAPQYLFALVATRDQQYVEARIEKRRNPELFRTLSIPRTGLKGVQRQICRAYLDSVEIDSAAYAYVRQRSVVQVAKALCGKAVLKIDIMDFFPSISDRRVYGMFRSLGHDTASCHILTKLCTYAGSLPQGAPSSPMISNIILRKLDCLLREQAAKWEMSYIRYSDDLFFYHSKNFNHPKFLALCSRYLTTAGFALNFDKTRYYARGVPRITLGLLTHNEAPAFPGRFRREIRNAFYRGARNVGWGQDNTEYLRGLLEWYKCVYGKDEIYFEYRSTLETILRLRLHISYQSG